MIDVTEKLHHMLLSLILKDLLKMLLKKDIKHWPFLNLREKLGQFSLDGIAAAPRGVPQIEVTFVVDIIMNIHAVDKASMKSLQITITNDKGRPQKNDIKELVKDAEIFKTEDEQTKNKIDAKNSLEQKHNKFVTVWKNQIQLSIQLKNELSLTQTVKLNNLKLNLRLSMKSSNQLCKASKVFNL